MKNFRFTFLVIFLLSGFVLSSCGDSVQLTDNANPSANPPGSTPPGAIPPPKPEIVSFSATKNCVRPGESFEIDWKTKNSEEVSIQGNKVDPSGKASWSVTEEGNLKLTAKNGNETVSQEISVYLKASSIGYYLSKEPYSFAPVQILASSLTDSNVLLLSNGHVFRGSIRQIFTEVHPKDGVTNWTALAIDPLNPLILYAATPGRVYRSTDGGASWPGVIPVRNLGSDMEIKSILPSPSTAGIVYIGFAGGAYRVDLRTNPGSMKLLSDLNGQEVRQIAEIKNSVVVATASTTTNLYISHNLGDNWSTFSNSSGSVINLLTANADHLYAGASWGGLYEVETAKPSLNLVQSLSNPIRDMRFNRSGVLYIAAQDGLSKFENGSWKKLVIDEINWILDSSTKEVLTPQGLMQLNQNTVYNDVCPNQK